MRRLILACCLLFIAAGAWWFGSSRTSAVASQPLTGAAIAQIEPELCSESALTQLLTIVPIAPRGGTHCGSRGAEGTKWENKSTARRSAN